MVYMVQSSHDYCYPFLSQFFSISFKEVFNYRSNRRFDYFLQANYHNVWHLLILSLLEDLNDVLIVSGRVPTCIKASDLDGDFVSLFDNFLLFLHHLIIDESLDDIMLRGGVQALQNQYTFLLEVICQCLLGPPLEADHLVLDLVHRVLMAFERHLGQHGLRT